MKPKNSGGSSFYKIPSDDSVIENRKLFYSLQRKNSETICKWFNRLQNSIDGCKFGAKNDSYFIDKFFNELNEREIEKLGRAKKWSKAKLKAIIFDDEKFGAKTQKPSKSNGTPTHAECTPSVSNLSIFLYIRR